MKWHHEWTLLILPVEFSVLGLYRNMGSSNASHEDKAVFQDDLQIT